MPLKEKEKNPPLGKMLNAVQALCVHKEKVQ